jgi:hypothetical protein
MRFIRRSVPASTSVKLTEKEVADIFYAGLIVGYVIGGFIMYFGLKLERKF